MSAIAGLDCKTDVEAFSVGKPGKVEKNNILRSTGIFMTNRNQALVDCLNVGLNCRIPGHFEAIPL